LTCHFEAEEGTSGVRIDYSIRQAADRRSWDIVRPATEMTRFTWSRI
jgi:hypothetical protein